MFNNIIEDTIKVLSTIKWPGIILVLIVLTIKYIEKIQIWISLIERILGKISSKYQRKGISDEIEGKINSYAKNLNAQFKEVLPYGIKIEWVEDDKEFDRESFLKENQVIVKIKPHINRDRNLVIASLEYVSRGLIPEARNYVSRHLMKAIDYKMVHKILLSLKANSAIEHFFSKIFPQETNDKKEISEYLEKLHEIDDRGLFVPIFLVELIALGKKIPPNVESYRKRAISEVKNFLVFVYNQAKASPGEQTELCFTSKEIKMGILLVAKFETSLHGADPYLKRFGKNIREGCDRVYVVSSGRNVDFAKKIVSEIESKFKCGKIFEQMSDVINRKGELTRGYTCLFQSTNGN